MEAGLDGQLDQDRAPRGEEDEPRAAAGLGDREPEAPEGQEGEQGEEDVVEHRRTMGPDRRVRKA